MAVQRLRGALLLCFALGLFACVDRYALPPPHPISIPPGPGSPALHAEAQRELAAARETAYLHAMRVDEDRGVFEYDCSGFVDYALSNVAGDALESLRAVRGRQRPNARTYVELLAGMAPGESKGRWSRVSGTADLQAGDVIAWLLLERKPDFLGNINSGHVMVVDGSPHERAPGEWVVPIIDASSTGHGGDDDRRRPERQTEKTGIGRGTVVIITEAGQPVGYRWTEMPQSKTVRTTVVLGRIL